jgi:hypothetical protein
LASRDLPGDPQRKAGGMCEGDVRAFLWVDAPKCEIFFWPFTKLEKIQRQTVVDSVQPVQL